MDVESDSAFVQSHQSPVAKNYAKFYPRWVRNNFLSEKEGKEVGAYKDFVMIICPGQPKSEVHREVREDDKRLYAEEWASYKAGKEQRLSGIPVDLLPGLDKSRADSLKAIYIYTIEQLAELSDIAKQKVGMGANDLVNRAKAYIANKTAGQVQLEAKIAELEKRLNEVIAENEQLKQKKKPGRPRKELKVA